MRKIIRFFSIIGLSAAFFTFYRIYLNQIDPKNYEFSKLVINNYNKNTFVTKSKNEEWIDLYSQVFFRLNSAIYIFESKKILIFFICHEKTYKELLKFFKFQIDAQIILDNLTIQKFNLNNINISRISADTRNLELSSTLDLPMTYFTRIRSFNISITLTLNNRIERVKAEEIQVKIRQYHFASSQDIFICLEPSFMEEKDILDLKWFLDLNSLIGFDKIIFNNNSIPNNRMFVELFEKNQKLVEIVPFNYLPNVVRPQLNKTYANHMEELTETGEEYSGSNILYHYINEFGINECLSNNRDRARFIFFPDTDETFLPVKLKGFDYPDETFKFLLNNRNLNNERDIAIFSDRYLSNKQCLRSTDDSSYLKEYLNGIYKKYDIPQESSLFLPQVFFLRQSFMEVFFNKLDTIIQKKITKYPLRIKIYQKHLQSESKAFKFHSSEWDMDFDLLIRNDSELNYAKNLLNLYKYLIYPFLSKHAKKLESKSERLTRFFYMDLRNDKATSSYVGKTFVNPRTSDHMRNPHVPDHKQGFLYGRDKNDLFHFPPTGHNQKIEFYYLAHFRDRYKIGKTAKSIIKFHLDLNYFSCYSRPLIEDH